VIPFLYLFYICMPWYACQDIKKYVNCQRTIPLDNPTMDEVELGNCIHTYTQPNQLGHKLLTTNNGIILDKITITDQIIVSEMYAEI
jgi:hypothetical protein